MATWSSASSTPEPSENQPHCYEASLKRTQHTPISCSPTQHGSNTAAHGCVPKAYVQIPTSLSQVTYMLPKNLGVTEHGQRIQRAWVWLCPSQGWVKALVSRSCNVDSCQIRYSWFWVKESINMDKIHEFPFCSTCSSFSLITNHAINSSLCSFHRHLPWTMMTCLRTQRWMRHGPSPQGVLKSGSRERTEWWGDVGLREEVCKMEHARRREQHPGLVEAALGVSSSDLLNGGPGSRRNLQFS